MLHADFYNNDMELNTVVSLIVNLMYLFNYMFCKVVLKFKHVFLLEVKYP